MPTKKFIQHDTTKFLKKKLKDKKYADIKDRLRALVMVSKKYSYSEVADSLGYSIQWVKKHAMDYARHGLDGLARKPHKGSEGFLTPDQLIKFYKIILDGPSTKSLLSRYRICDLREIAKNKFNVSYSVGGMHALLKRMKLSHVTTRPQNPKNDPIAAEIWKKKFSDLSMRKRKSIKILKSGTKTNPDSVKKALATESGRLRA